MPDFSQFKNIGRPLSVLFALFAVNACAIGATYYVSPTGSNQLSHDKTTPGSLTFALAGSGNGIGAAQKGDVVLLEPGIYDGSPAGYSVYNSGITLRSEKWHGAEITNSTKADLISPGPNQQATDVVCQGIVFGPSTTLEWSGGGGARWSFLDCIFTANGGVGTGNNSLFERDVFTDATSNAFDIGGAGVTFKDCIARRNNRGNADDDGVGNKDSYTANLTYDDFTAYDNNGTALWLDTHNDYWVIKNSTFFANHGGNNWYLCRVSSGISPSQYVGAGQDGQAMWRNQPVRFLSGTPADIGATSVITTVSRGDQQTITVNPPFPVTPSAGDVIIGQHVDASIGTAFITEANDCGTFTNNTVYADTDYGFFDHSSGGKVDGTAGGIDITNNLFAYNAEGIFVWSDQRDTGAADIEHNSFKFLPGKSSPFDSWGSTPGRYPSLGSITFDYNDYDPDNAKGNWVAWFGTSPAASAGGVRAGSQPPGQDYFQNPKTWNQDQHSNQDKVDFWGTSPATYIWPGAKDTDWKDDYMPNNVFGLSNSIHQIDDSDGTIFNTIDHALVGHKVGEVVILPVSAHTQLLNGICEVYDLNGRWMTLKVPAPLQASLLKTVSPYVSCVPGNKTVTYKIRVRLSVVDTYDIEGVYVTNQLTKSRS